MRRVTDVEELEKKYPMKYNEFKEKIIKLFLDEEEYYYGKKYSKKEKEEFLNYREDFKQDYRNACYYYDINENKNFNDEDLFFIVESLSVGCHSYFYRKDSSIKFEKGKYPLTMDEFKKKVTTLFFKTYYDPSLYEERVKAIEDEGPNLWNMLYGQACYDYDRAVDRYYNYESDYFPPLVFDEPGLLQTPVSVLNMMIP